MPYETILLEREDGVATITLNRPDKLNAVNRKMRQEVLCILEDLQKDPATRVVIFTGAGRGFCAGADITEFVDKGEESGGDAREEGDVLLMARRIYEFEKPIIGAINGVAAGDGAQWMLAFDLNVASEKARFAWPATALGIL